MIVRHRADAADNQGSMSILLPGTCMQPRRVKRPSAPLFFLVFSFIAVITGGFGGIPGARADTIEYVYDELDRLVGVVKENGESVRYNYDALGNITTIERTAAAAVTVLDFTPNSGPVGAAVIISGSGFSATLGQNSVRFNGVAAAVVSASATRLEVTVPAGATTGKISVTAPGGSATTTADFVVSSAAGAPTIASFTPTTGVAGTPVTITGTNFDVTPGITNVYFNQSLAPITAITATSVTVLAPPTTSSGRIRVRTLAGDGESTSDFIVPPPNFTAADILDVKRTVVGGPAQTISVNTSPKVGLLLFDRTKGDYLTIDVPTFNPSPSGYGVAVDIYAPNGALLRAVNTLTILTSTYRSIHIPVLPQSGTYTIAFRSGSTSVASSFTLSASIYADRTISADGAVLSDSLSFAGRSVRYILNGTADQNLDLVFSNQSIGVGHLNIYKPDATTLLTNSFTASFPYVNVPTLPVTGPYTFVVADPYTGATGNYSIALLSDVLGAIDVDGAASTVTIPNSGQTARLTFAGTAGQNLGLGITNLALAPATSVLASVYVSNPDGSYLINGSTCYITYGGCTLNLSNLPAAGTYSVVVVPYQVGTGSFTATLSSDVTGTLTAGTPFSLNLTRPGQNGRLSFAGAAGDSVAVRLAGVTTNPANQLFMATVYKPDGSQLSSLSVMGQGAILNLANLPATGTYVVFIDIYNSAQSATTASMQVTLDPGTPLAIDGTPVNMNLATAGDSARLTFSGTAGQSQGLAISNLALSGNGYATVAVYNPTGQVIVGGSYCYSSSGGCTFNFANLQATGTYSVVVAPSNGAIGSFTATLSSDVSSTLTVGTPFNLNLTRPGQNARLSFSATAGQSRTITVSSIATSPTGVSVTFVVYRPDGSLQTTTYSYSSSQTINLTSLPATGTYVLFVETQSPATATMAITLNP